MRGLMMDVPLTVPMILRRGEALSPRREVVTRLPDRSLFRYTYADFARRARQLASALRRLGLRDGDRVATLCWNHHQHLEAYFGIPLAGGVLHTLNLRLHPDDLAYIVQHAADRFLIVDGSLLPLLETFRARVALERVIVVGAPGTRPDGAIDYESLVTDGVPGEPFAEPDEHDAAAMCYTTGTTGKPKGVLYSHRALVLHSLGSALADTLGLAERDSVLPVVPMFHANAWGLPFTAVMVGARLVFPGPYLDPASLLDLLQAERVTFTAGVPTIWMGILQALDSQPGAFDLSSLRTMVVGGSAAPQSMIEAFERRHGLRIVHAWGMTETTPLGSVAQPTSEIAARPEAEQFAFRAKQGRPAPLVEIRARGGDGLVPWDGRTMGELEVRGPWVASAYYGEAGRDERFLDDGWFRTGDIVTIDEQGAIAIQDRAKDLIKSGGEWISSVALENALMGHPAIAEAAVIPVRHAKWGERPLAVVVLRPGASATADDLRAHLAGHVARWWLPDAVEFVDAIPKTSVGKFMKSALRQRFAEYELPA